jgi:hypothetical protein
LALVAGCTTPAPRTVTEPAEPGSGYFVALAASPEAPAALALHDALYDAIDAYSRKRAETQEALARYVEAFDADGYTHLADGKSEIECDRQKCLLKLAGRTVTGRLAEDLTGAFALKGIVPTKAIGGGQRVTTYVLGKSTGQHITCALIEEPATKSYRCDFALDGKKLGQAASAALDSAAAKGKLVSCAQAPGIERSADEAKDKVEGGELLKLASGAGAGAASVGFLRVARQGRRVELLDLYLCGDLSHDYFKVDGSARAPRGWLPKPARVGAPPRRVQTLAQEEARLDAASAVATETTDSYTLEVRFKVRRTAEQGPEVFGEDRFFVRLEKAWL